MNIGIVGRARSGKDTAGAWFVEQRGYRRVAFADPLKEIALRVNPIVDLTEHGDYSVDLSTVMADLGWEGAKDAHPEVRRILQELGSAVRAVDEYFWLRLALATAQKHNEDGVPVVITDVRYRNEAASLVRAGFRLIHIDRPGIPHLDHESEGALGPEDATFLVRNDGSVADLHARLDVIYDEVWALESARQALRH